MGSGSRCGYPQRREPSLTGDLYEPNISSLPRARCTAPPASACASPAGKPAAATGCCGRPGGRVALAAGHQPATPPPRRARDQQLPGALPPAHQRGPVRGAVGNRGAVGAGSLQRRLGPGRQPPHGRPPRGRVPPAQTRPGTAAVLPRHLQARGPQGAAAGRQGRPELWLLLAHPSRIHPSRFGPSRSWLMVGGCGWRSPPQCRSSSRTWTRVRSLGWILGIIHPFAVATQDVALLVSGRALRAEHYLHLEDQQTGQTRAARRAYGHHSAGCGQSAEPAAATLVPHPPAAGPAGQGRVGRDRGAAGGRARQLLHLPGLPPAGPPSPGAAGFAAVLCATGAPGSGRCRQYRRQGGRRIVERGAACAGGAPSGRRGAGAA